MSAATSDHSPTERERLLIVTGRLAEAMVQRVVEDLREASGLCAHVQVVGISVAALMHVDWLKRKLVIDGTFDRVILPGWCQGDLDALRAHFGLPFQRGPKDVQDLPFFLLGQHRGDLDLSASDIEIIAEINHAPQFATEEIVRQAREFAQAGADVIDLGCIPGSSWTGVGEVVAQLRREGLRVSIDSFDRAEVELAVEAGAELVLSCQSAQADWAARLPTELVVIPDDPARIETMWSTAQRLQEAGARFRLDPIIEPIGFGFARSLARYYEVRGRTSAPLLMGIGNVTEMAEVDSAGVNFLLAAICQELQIGSVLTTQVINWCRSSVAEFDRARRLVKYAIDRKIVPKRLTHELVMLRDPQLHELGLEALQTLQQQLKDPNYRIFVERGEIHVMNRDGYWRGADPYELFDRFSADGSTLDAAHAFYLGYELSKAMTALTLGKQYRQDQALRWGFLTIPEASAHDRRRRDASDGASV